MTAVILGLDINKCDGFFPRTREGRCQGCGVFSRTEKEHIKKHHRIRPQCHFIVKKDAFTGKKIESRQCRHRAIENSPYCGVHKKLFQKSLVESYLGGWCVWCTSPARRYECSRDKNLSIALCNECAKALMSEIRIQLSNH